jgi:hypothetical protein
MEAVMQWQIADSVTISPGQTVRWSYWWGGGPGGEAKAMGPMIATVAGSTLVTESNWVAAVNNGFSVTNAGTVYTVDVTCEALPDNDNFGNYSVWVGTFIE